MMLGKIVISVVALVVLAHYGVRLWQGQRGRRPLRRIDHLIAAALVLALVIVFSGNGLPFGIDIPLVIVLMLVVFGLMIAVVTDLATIHPQEQTDENLEGD